MFAHNDSLRVRITRRCNLSCGFCHEEGGDTAAEITMDQISRTLEFARRHGFRKFHLTGGEPTLHSGIVEIVRAITESDFSCGLTTNGQFEPGLLSELKDAGITSVNFSIHTVDPAAWAQIQQHTDLMRSERQIARAISNIKASVSLGIRTKANIVVGHDPFTAVDVVEALRGTGVEFRLLNALGSNESLISISFLLAHYEARMTSEMHVMGSSQYRTTYDSTVGDLVVKEIHQYRELTVCKGCKENCHEGFYGIRIVPLSGDVFARLCIHRTCDSTLMPLERFESSPQLAAIIASGGLRGVHDVRNSTTGLSLCRA